MPCELFLSSEMVDRYTLDTPSSLESCEFERKCTCRVLLLHGNLVMNCATWEQMYTHTQTSSSHLWLSRDWRAAKSHLHERRQPTWYHTLLPFLALVRAWLGVELLGKVWVSRQLHTNREAGTEKRGGRKGEGESKDICDQTAAFSYVTSFTHALLKVTWTWTACLRTTLPCMASVLNKCLPHSSFHPHTQHNQVALTTIASPPSAGTLTSLVSIPTTISFMHGAASSASDMTSVGSPYLITLCKICPAKQHQPLTTSLWAHIPPGTLSLSLSLSHTHTHTPFLFPLLSLSLPPSLTVSCSCSGSPLMMRSSREKNWELSMSPSRVELRRGPSSGHWGRRRATTRRAWSTTRARLTWGQRRRKAGIVRIIKWVQTRQPLQENDPAFRQWKRLRGKFLVH